MSENSSVKITGWRLDLVRLRPWWKGAEHLKAKLELFTLLAKSQMTTLSVEVCIVTDTDTFERCYQRWLQEEGLDSESLPERFNLIIIDLDRRLLDFQAQDLSPVEIKKDNLTKWLIQAEEIIGQQWDADDRLFPDFPPDFLIQHQQTESDSILAIWDDASTAEN